MRRGNLVAVAELGWSRVVAANLYVIFFNVSWGPVMWVMLGEMFPNQIRGSALAVAGFAQWFANFLVAQTFPPMAEQPRPGGQLHLLRRVRGDQLLPGPEVHPRDQGQGARGDGGLTPRAGRSGARSQGRALFC